jgi:hypothetical protein
MRLAPLALIAALASCTSRSIDLDAASVDAALDAAREKSVITAYEGQACSSDPAEEPQLRCSRDFALTCLSTYSIPVAGSSETRPVFVCRFPCALAGAACPQPSQPSDICCPGTLVDGSQGKGCVPARFCSARPDGGTQ